MVNAVKVFKKSSLAGKVTAYLCQRDFVDNLTHTLPIDGVVVVEDQYLRGRKVFASVIITFRYGREQDEVMGLRFSKEYELVNIEIPPKTAQITNAQTRLLEKLGDRARPFSIVLPENSPSSVSLEAGDNKTDKPLGVSYELKIYAAETSEIIVPRKYSVNFVVRKVQYAPARHNNVNHPYAMIHKGFSLSPGRLNLEIGLNRDIYFHGQLLETCIKVENFSKRTVKSIRAQVIQHVEVTMTNSHFSRIVAGIESSEGCPITPDTTYERTVDLTPLASNFKRFGIALDGTLKDEDVNLASTTLAAPGKSVEDSLGIIVSYSVRIKLLCGAISGELSAEVPFVLMHPNPDDEAAKYGQGLEFAEFSNFRRGKSIEEERVED